MKIVTVYDLKIFLKDIPDNYTVILSKDSEGNFFSPLSSEISLGSYKPENSFMGNFLFDDKEPSSIALFPMS